MSILSGLTGITKDIGDAFGNVSPILAATGVIKANNAHAQPPVVSTKQTASSNTQLILIVAGGGMLVLLLVVLIARKK